MTPGTGTMKSSVDLHLLEAVTFSKHDLQDIMSRGQLTLKPTQGRAKNVNLIHGTQIYNWWSIGNIWHDHNKDMRLGCSGERFIDRHGTVHPDALVLVIFHVSYMERESYTHGSHVPMNHDDGSCELPHNQ